MRKEVIVAVFAGLTIGLIIAFGVWRINSSQPQINTANSSQNQNLNTDGNESLDSTHSNKLSLTGIEEGQIFTDSVVKILGLASGAKIVLASAETDDYIAEVQSDATFEQSIKLIKGVNKITLISLSPTGQENDKLIFTVVYYPEFDKTESD